MIRYALHCGAGHEFEGWFASSAAFDAEEKRGALTCPVCGDAHVGKQLMAPSLPARAEAIEPSEVMLPSAKDVALRQAMKAFRDHVVANTEDVGERFADEARKIHYEETEHRSIRGRASLDEARALHEEGIAVAPLPVLPEDRN